VVILFPPFFVIRELDCRLDVPGVRRLSIFSFNLVPVPTVILQSARPSTGVVWNNTTGIRAVFGKVDTGFPLENAIKKQHWSVFRFSVFGKRV
jgi:hypothetical protein